MSINITERLRKARQLEREKHLEGESAKMGTLRAGATGIRATNGDIAGACHRKAHLRSLGIELDAPTEDKIIMFELGYANEDVIFADLISTASSEEIILREEEIPISWQTRNGTKVTGRPDMVICQKHMPMEGMSEEEREKYSNNKRNLVPILGLELKSVHSMWTIRDLLFEKGPKLENIAQAAHYMWKLDIPYKLIYKSYSNLGQSVSDWAARLFPKQGEPGSEYLEYNEKGGMKQIKQFEIVFDLRIDKNGRIQFRREPSHLDSSTNQNGSWQNTIVTIQDIEAYYEFVSKIAETGNLGPRPLTTDSQGNKKNWNMCDSKYCPLSATCDKYEKSYTAWLAEVRKITGEKK